MKTRNLYMMVVAFMVMLGIQACSDNSDLTRRPTGNDRYIRLEADGQTTSDESTGGLIKFDYDSGSRTIPVTVSSNTLWKVEVTGGGWCSVDVARGQGDGTFTISITNNRAEPRNAEIKVVQIDSSGNEYDGSRTADIEIVQDGSNIYITPSSLEIFPAENAPSQKFDIVANAEWTLSVRLETELTGDFITIIPVEGMTEVEGSSQTFTGTGNASFSISLQNNGTGTVRKAYIELKSENGNTSVEISQQKSENIFDVSPNTTIFVAAAGDDKDFSVYSPNENWSVVIPENSWIKFEDTHFSKSDVRVTVKMTVEPNISGRERRETIFFKSNNTAYELVPVVVVQSGFDLTFNVTLNDQTRIISETGGDFSFNVNSMFRWRVARAASWISVPTDEVEGSVDAATVNVTVARNTSNEQREDSIKVIPLTTYFDGIPVNPEDVGIRTIKVPVMQYGGQRPAVSTPWLMDGYGYVSEEQSSADLEFSYYSPFVTVEKAGLQWMKASETNWDTAAFQEVEAPNPNAANIPMSLDNLDPATEYVARGYVICSNGQRYPGSATFPFRTAGRYPSANDNPTPSR